MVSRDPSPLLALTAWFVLPLAGTDKSATQPDSVFVYIVENATQLAALIVIASFGSREPLTLQNAELTHFVFQRCCQYRQSVLNRAGQVD